MKQVAGLIGDVVASRQVADRPALQERLLEVLERVSEQAGSPLSITLGDEFQGRYARLSDALAAAWHLHLGTIGLARLRIGVGWGEILVEPESPSAFGSDGPAWWRAREAIERVDSSQPARTIVVTETGWDQLLNSYLMLRDAHLDDLDEADVAILEGLEEGDTQRALAERLGLHESSVSRRVSRHGLATLRLTATPRFPDVIFDA
ncbi:MAG TPA: SatD family protein [Acidimicrobiia bacterium]|nr:SatD family protein [Acidimicrobiia bacterium]